jgi:hypothetical protein
MGFKYQVLSCNSPQQLLHITLTHLESLKKIVKSEKVEELVQVAIDKAIETYATLSNGQWMLLKQSLMRFLQGKKTKVSLFLQQGLQMNDGTLILNISGKLPYGTESPGVIRYYEGKGLINTKYFQYDNGEQQFEEAEGVLDVHSYLGGNIYNKDSANDAKSIYSESSITADSAMGAMYNGGLHRAQAKPKRQILTQKSAKAELNLLSDLLGLGNSAKDEKSTASSAKPFKINLFPNTFDSKAEGKDDDYESGSNGMIMFDIDATHDSKSMSAYMHDLDLDDDDYKSEEKGDDNEDNDDLLALMDSAKQ